MRFQFIDDHRDEFPVRRMCKVLEVSPTGYCVWRERSPSKREMANRKLTDLPWEGPLFRTQQVEYQEEARQGGSHSHRALTYDHSGAAGQALREPAQLLEKLDEGVTRKSTRS